jgi:hypothetical protein
MDVQAGTLDALLDDGIVHVPDDMWVRTFERADFERLLQGFRVERLVPTHYLSSGPFEAAAGPVELSELLAYEERLRALPVTAPLNRAWTAVARKI